ncbi:mechanosensitive ion channel family protein [Lysobacter korlensis]|uniref:Small-conductance mechanosensitive channel n=1 Tax=Lysobacter korlensis TaxID=553636 RepID=A0ABV6RRI6_9GAMM
MSTAAVTVNLESVLARLAVKAERFLALLPLFVVAALVVWIAWMVGGWVSRRAFFARAGRHHPFLQDLVRSSVRWAVTAIGILVALEILGATKLVGAALGTAGVLGVALGFAFKDILENYLAGILLSLRQPFGPRDLVEIDGNEGVVVALTSRATILMTLDGNHLRIPNAKVFSNVILNYTRNPLRRLQFDIGIGMQEDLGHVREIGIKALASVPGVVDTPPPRVRMIALGDWAVQARFLAWVDQRTHEFLLVQSEAIRIVKEAMDDAGVDMPYPTYQIRPGVEAAQTSAAVRADPADEPSKPRRAEAMSMDTRKTTDILDQVDADHEERGGQDLLNPNAPTE